MVIHLHIYLHIHLHQINDNWTICFLISAFIVPEVPNVSICTFLEEIFSIDWRSLIVLSFSVWLHKTIPLLPSNLIKRMPLLLQLVWKRFVHCDFISWSISALLISPFFIEDLTRKPIYLWRLVWLDIFTPQKWYFYSDSIRGASKYVTCPFFSAISNSTLIGLSFPIIIVIESSPLTGLIILLK